MKLIWIEALTTHKGQQLRGKQFHLDVDLSVILLNYDIQCHIVVWKSV